jgi:hypothetical protein
VEAKVGDRVSIDAKKVGQPRRTGVVSSVAKGLSGVRYGVRWDDGNETFLSPGSGNLTVESGGKAKRSSNSKSKRAKARKLAKGRKR